MNCFGFNNIYISKFKPNFEYSEIESLKLDHDQIMVELYSSYKHSELNNWKSVAFFENAFHTACVNQVRYEFKLLANNLSSGRAALIYTETQILLNVNFSLESTMVYLLSLQPQPNLKDVSFLSRIEAPAILESIDEKINHLNDILDLQYFQICKERLSVYSHTRNSLRLVLSIYKSFN